MFRETGNQWNIAYSLEAFTALAVAQGDMPRAARLFGATESFYSLLRFLMSPLERDHHERDLAATRSALGEEVFSALCAEGRAMSIEQAVAYALDD
jgi:hypothetical protein